MQWLSDRDGRGRARPGAVRRVCHRSAADNGSAPELEAERHQVACRQLGLAAPVPPVEVDLRTLSGPEDVHDGFAAHSERMRNVNLTHSEPVPAPEEAGAWRAEGKGASRTACVREPEAAPRESANEEDRLRLELRCLATRPAA